MIKKETEGQVSIYVKGSVEKFFLMKHIYEKDMNEVEGYLGASISHTNRALDELLRHLKFNGKVFNSKQGKLSVVICDITTEENLFDMMIDVRKRLLGLFQSTQKMKEKIELEFDKWDKEYIYESFLHIKCAGEDSIYNALSYLTLYEYEFEEADYIQYVNIKESGDVMDMIYEVAEKLDEIIDLLYKTRNRFYFDNNEKQELRMPQDTPIEFGVCKGYRTLENALHVGYGHEMWRSYHSYKNPEALPGCVMTSLVAIFIRSGWVIIVLTWIWYYLFCKSNNKKLAEHPMVKKKKQEFFEKQSKKVITQDMVDYCNYYKIPIKYYEDEGV